MKIADCKPKTRAKLTDCAPIDGTEVEIIRASSGSVTVALTETHPRFHGYQQGTLLNVHAYQLVKTDELSPENIAALDAAMRDGMQAVFAHTPTPWVAGGLTPGYVYSTDATGSVVATCAGFKWAPRPDIEVEANAAFIVRACNAYDQLVMALREVREELEQLVITDLAQGDRKDACFTLVDRALALAVRP